MAKRFRVILVFCALLMSALLLTCGTALAQAAPQAEHPALLAENANSAPDALPADSAAGADAADAVANASRIIPTGVSVFHTLDATAGTVHFTIEDVPDYASDLQILILSEEGASFVTDAYPVGDTSYEGVADFRAAGLSTGYYTAQITACIDGGPIFPLAETTVAFESDELQLFVEEAAEGSTVFMIRLDGTLDMADDPVWFRMRPESVPESDAIVYPTVRSGYSFSARVDVSEYGKSGRYLVTAFTGQPGEDENVLATADFQAPGVNAGSVTIGNISPAQGTFQVTAQADAPSGISLMRIAVWQADDQSDLRWYEATQEGDSWKVAAHVANHGYHQGAYKAHAYAVLRNGLEAFVAGTQDDVRMHNYVLSNRGHGVIELSVLGPDTTDVKAAVWSKAGGQDDLIWYNMRLAGDGLYTVQVPVSAHHHGGVFISHVYAGNSLLGAFEHFVSPFEMDNSVQSAINAGCEKVYAQVGRDLRACYDWVVDNLRFTRRGQFVVPPAGMTREDYYALEGFSNRRGDCYTFAATFAALARGLGYDTEYAEGQVYTVHGSWGNHGFTVIYDNGGTYICDPELQHGGFRTYNLFMQPSYASRIRYRW